MRPGPDQQVRDAPPGALGHLEHRRVLAERPGSEDVVPAADMERVGLHSLVEVDGPRPPVQRGVRRPAHRRHHRVHHAARQLGEPAQRKHLEQLAGRQPGARRTQLGHRLRPGLGAVAVPPRDQVGADQELHPAQPRSFVRTAGPLLRLEGGVDPGDAGDQAPQGRGPHDRGTPLCLRVIGPAEHPDLAGGSRQPCGPLHRVVAVVELLLARDELAVRGVPAADVLHHDHVAACGQQDRVGVHQVDVGVLVVRLPRQQHRVRTTPLRAVHVGAQHDPVPHRRLDVVLDEDVVSRHDETGHGAEAYVFAPAPECGARRVRRCRRVPGGCVPARRGTPPPASG